MRIVPADRSSAHLSFPPSPTKHESVKFRAKSVEVPPGGAFSFPLHSPGPGSLVRVAFQVHDGKELEFELWQGGARVHAVLGEAHEGEVVVPAEGLCEARWAQQFSWVGAGMLIWSPVTVSYEVVVVPPQHLAHARVRQLLQIARHGTVAELQAALENTPPSDSDEAFPRPFLDRPFLHRSCTVPGPFL